MQIKLVDLDFKAACVTYRSRHTLSRYFSQVFGSHILSLIGIYQFIMIIQI